VLGPTPLVGPSTMQSPASTVPELQKPFTTVPGLAPPPIPVPQGIATPPPGSLPPPVPGSHTLLGIQNAKAPPAIPLGKLDFKNKKPGVVPNVPSQRAQTPPPLPQSVDDARRTGPRAERPSALMRAIDEADVIPPSSIGTALPPSDHGAPRSTDPGLGVFEQPTAVTAVMSPLLVEQSSDALTMPTVEMQPLVQEALQAHARDELPNEAHATEHEPPHVSRHTPIPQRSSPMPAHSMTASTRPAPGRSRMPWILAGALGVAVLGLGGWWAYNEFVAPESNAGSGTKVVTPAAGDAGAKTTDAAAVTPDAAIAVVTDAGKAAPTDAAVAVAPVVDATVAVVEADAGAIQPTPSDQLVITSTPSRARVFLDGADVGATPLKLPGTPDRHTIAVLMAGHELYVAQVDGHGSFAIPLKEVTPSGGPAGIKVTRCKDKDRYYVFVDGKPTGMTCPTERIEVELGAHVVEVYDVVSDSRKKYDVDVKDTRLSVRVKIE
jgi:hypothetical protein